MVLDTQILGPWFLTIKKLQCYCKRGRTNYKIYLWRKTLSLFGNKMTFFIQKKNLNTVELSWWLHSLKMQKRKSISVKLAKQCWSDHKSVFLYSLPALEVLEAKPSLAYQTFDSEEICTHFFWVSYFHLLPSLLATSSILPNLTDSQLLGCFLGPSLKILESTVW